MKMLRKLILSFVLLVLFSIALLGGTNSWTYLGPEEFYPISLTVSPSNSSTIYAGDWGNRIFISSDDGNNWIRKQTSFAPKDIIIDPTIPSTMYAFDGYKFYKSIDGGDSWFVSNLGLPNDLNQCVMDKTNTSKLYLATSSGVYKTEDAAQSWSKAGVVDPNYDSATYITIDPQNASVLYVSNYYGIYKSEDSGSTWKKMSTPSNYSYDFGKIEVNPFDNTILYADLADRIFKSVDGGNTWTMLYVGGLNSYYSYDFVLSKSNQDVIYVMLSSNSLYKSSDGGVTWQLLSIPPITSYYSVKLYSFPNNHLFILSSDIIKSSDEGQSFTYLGVNYERIKEIVFSPTDSNIMYIATTQGGVKKSTNKGQSFFPINNGLTDLFITTIAIDKNNSNTLYVGTYSGNIFKTTDGGNSWQKIYSISPQSSVNKIAVDPVNSSVLYACTSQVGMIKSSNGGSSWISINTGISTTYINNFSFNPQDSNTIFAATQNGLYKTTNGGDSWSLTFGQNINFNDVVYSPVNPNLMFATVSYSEYNFYKSVDGGNNWQGISNVSFEKLYPDPNSSNIIFGLRWDSLFRSTDEGSTFSQIPDPTHQDYYYLYVVGMAFDPINHNNIFGLTEVGIFTMEISCGAISVSPATLPDGNENQYYNQTISYSGGLSPYYARINSGSLPPGLNFNNYYDDYCIISGTPTSPGSFNFTIGITDSIGCSIQKNYTINITPCATITISPDTLPTAYVNQLYDQFITASGGTSPYSFYLYSGYPPPGILFYQNGELKGTPSSAGNYTFIVKAVDASSCSATKSYTLRVEGGIVIDPPTLPSGIVGESYSQQLSASGGTAPYIFSISTGSMPNGLTLSSKGLLSGTPTAEGTYSFTVKVLDTNGKYGEQSYTLIVNNNLTCTITSSVSETKVGIPVTFTATIAGGSGGYRILWDFGDGIQGVDNPATHIYSKLGTFNVTATVTDSGSHTATSNTLQIKVISDLTISFNVSPEQGNAPLKVTFTSAATGGEAPYTFNWDFGDGSTSTEQNSEHTYTKDGTYNWSLKVVDAAGRVGVANGTIVVDKPLNPPTITSVVKASSPFRLIVNGYNFKEGCNVYINGVAVPLTVYKSSYKVVAKKGKALKMMVPKGVTVEITVKNSDGVESEPFYYTR